MATGLLRSHVGMRGFAFAALMVGVLQPVQAQSRLGAVGESGPLAPSGVTLPAASDAEHRRRAELIASQLLDRARGDLTAGERQIAQRVLEQLIASFPETSAASEARRHLYALYASDARIWVRDGSAEKPAPASQNTVAGARPFRDSASTRGRVLDSAIAASSWRTSIISFKRLQDELRNGIGDRIFFSAGSADIGSRARALLTAQAEWLLRRPDVEVMIEGHADDAMTGADNEQIALVRAGAVRDRLVAEGVPPERIHVAAQGARDPVAVCQDTDCAAQNRRAIVQVGLRQSVESGRP